VLAIESRRIWTVVYIRIPQRPPTPAFYAQLKKESPGLLQCFSQCLYVKDGVLSWISAKKSSGPIFSIFLVWGTFFCGRSVPSSESKQARLILISSTHYYNRRCQFLQQRCAVCRICEAHLDTRCWLQRYNFRIFITVLGFAHVQFSLRLYIFASSHPSFLHDGRNVH